MDAFGTDHRLELLQAMADGLSRDQVAARFGVTLLRRLGCETGQGYLISRPLSIERAEAFLAERRQRAPRVGPVLSAAISP